MMFSLKGDNMAHSSVLCVTSASVKSLFKACMAHTFSITLHCLDTLDAFFTNVTSVIHAVYSVEHDHLARCCRDEGFYSVGTCSVRYFFFFLLALVTEEMQSH